MHKQLIVIVLCFLVALPGVAKEQRARKRKVIAIVALVAIGGSLC